MKQSFSFRRYGLLLRKYMREEYRTQILIFSLLLLVFIGIRAFGNLMVYMMSTGSTPHDDAVGFSLLLQYPAMYCAASIFYSYQTAHSMPFMRNRVRHIAYLMIPASNREKFATSVTISYCLPIVYSFLAFHLSNLIQMPFTGEWMRIGADFSMIVHEALETEPQLAELLNGFTVSFVIYCIVSIIFTGAWFSASATLFRRHPFLLGSIIIYLAGQVFGLIFLAVNFNLFYGDVQSPGEMAAALTNYFYVVSAIYAALTPVLYIFAYRRMKSAEV